jgi:hypothetical protein
MRGLIPRNPCDAVPALPIDRHELDYLRLHEIQPYLAQRACTLAAQVGQHCEHAAVVMPRRVEV